MLRTGVTLGRTDGAEGDDRGVVCVGDVRHDQRRFLTSHPHIGSRGGRDLQGSPA